MIVVGGRGSSATLNKPKSEADRPLAEMLDELEMFHDGMFQDKEFLRLLDEAQKLPPGEMRDALHAIADQYEDKLSKFGDRVSNWEPTEKMWEKTVDYLEKVHGIPVYSKGVASDVFHRIGFKSYGFWDSKTRSIYVDPAQPFADRMRILWHEMGHGLLGHKGGNPKGKTYAHGEIEAESVSYLISRRMGGPTMRSYFYVQKYARPVHVNPASRIKARRNDINKIVSGLEAYLKE